MTNSLVTGVDFVSIPTKDIETARKFYGETLGLERSKVWQKGEGKPLGAEFETGTVTIAVIASEGLGIEPKPIVVPVAFQVDDVEAARAELQAKGVEFRGETIDSGVCHMANFTDPDGNALMLHHRYAPSQD